MTDDTWTLRHIMFFRDGVAEISSKNGYASDKYPAQNMTTRQAVQCELSTITIGTHKYELVSIQARGDTGFDLTVWDKVHGFSAMFSPDTPFQQCLDNARHGSPCMPLERVQGTTILVSRYQKVM